MAYFLNFDRLKEQVKVCQVEVNPVHGSRLLSLYARWAEERDQGLDSQQAIFSIAFEFSASYTELEFKSRFYGSFDKNLPPIQRARPSTNDRPDIL